MSSRMCAKCCYSSGIGFANAAFNAPTKLSMIPKALLGTSPSVVWIIPDRLLPKQA